MAVFEYGMLFNAISVSRWQCCAIWKFQCEILVSNYKLYKVRCDANIWKKMALYT